MGIFINSWTILKKNHTRWQVFYSVVNPGMNIVNSSWRIKLSILTVKHENILL